MSTLRRAALLAVLVTATISTVGHAQTVSVTGLLRQVDSLRTRVNELERRVADLEALIRGESPRSRALQPLPDPTDVANWRKLRRGMTPEGVRALLGEPVSVRALPSFTIWTYPDRGAVTFDSDKLNGWDEPERP